MVKQQETLFLRAVKYLLSLGSNVGNRAKNLSKARMELKRSFGEIISASPVYETPPWGFNANQAFYNQVVCVDSALDPVAFLNLVLQIERTLGRERKKEIGYASRNIDIDILLVDELIVKSPHLTIPHPEMHNRRFVLKPAMDIVPNWKHPVLGMTINGLLDTCSDKSEIKSV